MGMTTAERIWNAAVNVKINSLDLDSLCALLSYSYKWDWLKSNFNGDAFRTFALFVAEDLK